VVGLSGALQPREVAACSAYRGFLRLVVDADSVLSFLSVLWEVAKLWIEGYEAYVRVLLGWCVHWKFWFDGFGEGEISVELALLDALKSVVDPS
jgi:hypothetical protein